MIWHCPRKSAHVMDGPLPIVIHPIDNPTTSFRFRLLSGARTVPSKAKTQKITSFSYTNTVLYLITSNTYTDCGATRQPALHPSCFTCRNKQMQPLPALPQFRVMRWFPGIDSEVGQPLMSTFVCYIRSVRQRDFAPCSSSLNT